MILILYVRRISLAEKRRTLEQLRSASKLINTEQGTIEYAVRGQGSSLLYFHGGMGGYEQGLTLAEILNLEDFQFITFSRPGYRRTNITIGGSLPAQAEAACKVLDHLGIKTATVIALSAGGMSALQFAQDYPERCRALIMLSAHGPELAKTQPSKFWLWLLDLMLASDFFVWMMMRYGMALLTHLLRAEETRRHIPHVKAFFAGVFPASDWRVGTANDVTQLIEQQSIALATIRVPTLILHGSHDVIVPPKVAENNAANIPQAQRISIEGGSHIMFVTHPNEINQRLRDFAGSNQGAKG